MPLKFGENRYGYAEPAKSIVRHVRHRATLMILKAASMYWLTVIRMMQVKGGFRSPEDLRKTPLNPEPDPNQLAPNEYVQCIRRIQLNDLENLPFFLVAPFLYVRVSTTFVLARHCAFSVVNESAAGEVFLDFDNREYYGRE